MNIEETISKYKNAGLGHPFALARTCQDIILHKIVKSGFGSNVTIKGGVVMMNISNDIRRATRDLDLDFIKYSLEDNSIRMFIDKLNTVDLGNPLTADYLADTLKDILKKHDFPHTNPRKLRHLFATMCVNSGITINQLQNLNNSKSPSLCKKG